MCVGGRFGKVKCKFFSRHGAHWVRPRSLNARDQGYPHPLGDYQILQTWSAGRTMG